MLAFKTVLAVFFIAAISAAPVEEDGLVKRVIHSSGPGTYFYRELISRRAATSAQSMLPKENARPGNCGRYSKDSEYVVALNNKQYANGKNVSFMSCRRFNIFLTISLSAARRSRSLTKLPARVSLLGCKIVSLLTVLTVSV